MADDQDNYARATKGARITRTGIALVHEGELVLPAAGSEVQAETVLDDARQVVEYVFPVEIEVHGEPQQVDLEAVITATLDRLHQSLMGL